MRLTGTLMAFCGAALGALFIWMYFEACRARARTAEHPCLVLPAPAGWRSSGRSEAHDARRARESVIHAETSLRVGVPQSTSRDARVPRGARHGRQALGREHITRL